MSKSTSRTGTGYSFTRSDDRSCRTYFLCHRYRKADALCSTGTVGQRFLDPYRRGWKSYDIIAEQLILPTSELPSHLMMHNYLRGLGRDNRVVLHTHPTDLIGMTHCKPFLDSDVITRTLWSMIPECRIIVPKGVGIVPYEIPGTLDLARATIKQLEKHDVVFWEKHGILAVGEDLIECFDAIDTLSKSAQIYFSARMAGYEPAGMTDKQLDDLVPAFGL